MNDFVLYHNLCNLCAQIEPFAANQELYLDLKKTTQQYSSKAYRVAVIGEFKRGKSSLVNALVGAEILPTDILPTTAVINRIVYSVDQKIDIYFKNGEMQTNSVASLADYATKLDPEKEQFAQTIDQIVVHYPFVLGQNHIELIDTPGLNDNETMTETTLNVMGQIDTAIVVISAAIPVSQTEQNLICDLIRQTDIYNLIFAVTFIDRVSDEEEEQDRVVALIKNRLTEDTLQHFCNCITDPQLIEKAKRILLQPNVYAVSSKQAIQGFVKGRNDLLEKSRFKHFKYSLSALLTANQEKDCLLKIKRICAELEVWLPQWIQQHLQNLDERIRSDQMQREALQSLLASSQAYLNKTLLQLEEDTYEKKDELLLEVTKGAEIQKHLERFFIAQLSAIRRKDFCQEAVLAALQRGSTDACQFMNTASAKLKAEMDALSKTAFEEITLHYEQALGQPNGEISTDFSASTPPAPVFTLSGEEIFGNMCSLEDSCMPYVTKAIAESLTVFNASLEAYMAACRVVLIGYHKQIKTVLDGTVNSLAVQIADQQLQLQNNRAAWEQGQIQITQTISKIKEIIS